MPSGRRHRLDARDVLPSRCLKATRRPSLSSSVPRGRSTVEGEGAAGNDLHALASRACNLGAIVTATFRLPSLAYALGLLAVAAAGCRHGVDTREGRAADSSDVVAKVGDAVITVGDVETRIKKQASFSRARLKDPAKKRQLVDELVQNEALANEALRRGYDKDPDVQQAVKQQMVSRLLKQDFESKLKVEDVPDADVEKYYNEHLAGDARRAPGAPVRDRTWACGTVLDALAPPR